MTASKSFAWSKTLRKSLNFFAFGKRCAAASTAVWLMSQSTVMFSAGMPVGTDGGGCAPPCERRPPLGPSPFMFAVARPPQAIMAMFSFSFRALPRRNAGAPVTTAEAERAPTNSRRVIRRCRVFAVVVFIVMLQGSFETIIMQKRPGANEQRMPLTRSAPLPSLKGSMSFLLECPNCGPRDVYEFRFGGEYQRRPPPDAAGPAWAEYLFFRTNAAGVQTEWWYHRLGCKAWFLGVRD